MSKSPTLFSSDDEDEGFVSGLAEPELEEVLLKKLQAMMQGIPPPSSITMSKLSVTDMLEKYKENGNCFGFGDLVEQKHCKNKNATPLVYYFNSSKTSEEIAILSQKVLSRYVYSETMSSCNIWFESSTMTASAKKNLARRSRLGFSPGNRLSHLARRRQIFSSENLQKLANSERRRHIEIEKQNTSKNKSFSRNSLPELEKSNSFKRALFLSPDEDDDDGPTKRRKLSVSSQNSLVSNSSKSILQDNSQSIWLSQQDFDTSSSKRRKRLESRERSGNWPRRALTFTDKELCKNEESIAANTKVMSEIQLSLHHKTKILWAVSVTLKEKKVHSKDPHFKSCASALFMICRKNLTKILNMKIEGGTSDKILHFARGHVDDIFKKLGISEESKPEETDTREMLKTNSNSDASSESLEQESLGLSEASASSSAKNPCSNDISLVSPSTSSIAADVDSAASNEKENVTEENSLGSIF